MKNKNKSFAKRHKVLYAANLCLDEYNTDKVTRRICMFFLTLLLVITIAAIV